jgi:hypothetical protein
MERIGGCAQGQKSQRAVDFFELAAVEKLGTYRLSQVSRLLTPMRESSPSYLLLLAIDLVVLRRNDLPLTVSL